MMLWPSCVQRSARAFAVCRRGSGTEGTVSTAWVTKCTVGGHFVTRARFWAGKCSLCETNPRAARHPSPSSTRKAKARPTPEQRAWAQPLGLGVRVDVARPDRAALRRDASAIETDEGERLSRPTLCPAVAAGHIREAPKVQRCDERVAQRADGPAVVGRIRQNGDAVVAAYRLGEDPVVGHRLAGAQERAALG